MSTTLKWRPIKGGRSLPYALKRVLADQTLGVWKYSSIEYLRGLRDAKVEGAQELIDALEKHGEVELFLEA